MATLCLSTIRQMALEHKSHKDLALFIPKNLEFDAQDIPGFVDSAVPNAKFKEHVDEIGRIGRIHVVLTRSSETCLALMSLQPDGSEPVRMEVTPSDWQK